MSLIKSESYKRGTVLSVLFNGISKGVLFLLTIIIARYFGSNIKTDIYFFVFGTMVLFSGFINNIDTAVLIPESMRLREKEGDQPAAAFLNSFLRIYLVIGIVFTVFMYISGTWLFKLISKFSETDIETYRNYFWLGSLFFIFMIITNLLNTILTSLKFFSLPMIISGINSCIVIAAIFLLRAHQDVLSILIGGLAAFIVNLFILLYVLKKMAGWNFMIPATGIPKKVWRNIFYSELGQITTVAGSLLPLYLLSGFGTGVISVMNYGKNIADIPNTLVTAQFAAVSGIKLNEQVARQDHAGMNDTFLRTSRLLVFILVPAGFFCFVFADPIVALFYQNSNFDAAATAAAAVFLKLLAITIFSIGINAVVTRLFIAVQAIRQAFFYQVALNCLLIAALLIGTRNYGAYGYPYAVIIMNMVNFFTMYFICKKLVPYINYAALMKYTAVVLLINAVIAAGLYIAVITTGLNGFSGMVLGFILYLIILVVLNKKFNINTDLGLIIKHAEQKFN